MLACLLVIVRTDFEGGAVGGQSGMEGGRNARPQVAAHHVGPHQADLRLLFLKQIDHHCRVGQRSIGRQSRRVENVQAVHAVGQDLGFDVPRDAGPGGHGLELHAQLVGQFAALGQQFLAYLGHRSAFKLAIYKYVVHESLSDCMVSQ